MSTKLSWEATARYLPSPENTVRLCHKQQFQQVSVNHRYYSKYIIYRHLALFYPMFFKGLFGVLLVLPSVLSWRREKYDMGKRQLVTCEWVFCWYILPGENLMSEISSFLWWNEITSSIFSPFTTMKLPAIIPNKHTWSKFDKFLIVMYMYKLV